VRGIAGAAVGAAGDLAGALVDGIADLVGGRLPDAIDLSLADDFVDSLLSGRGRQVLLKQFRDARDGRLACYQAVVEAPVRMTRVRGRPLLGAWDVTIHELDSHPIGRDMGLVTQSTSLAFELEIDFVCGEGVVIG
jgi:hypothetical protein